ncbi:hypothetical protein [Aggregatibacter actinomycetemcomitans]|uniref:hypothetical protein n=1 Tax=Aggregatibacter actinomycetemcomitans TaxID=714 RepID=UPI00197B1919|nr:hypothetical protein [Aggregatibacter actinomycetemcomitans]MBN6058684.1 hypothetical protein [Aggregatibacter actinomycetemcomitans]MBN6087193.1 hypothetical protein [Aggregatibacter actinomycetemcomitans]
MSSSPNLELYDVPSGNSLNKSTLSFRVGKHLGRFFVAAKNKVTDKYKQMTSGINQSTEDEEARRRCELQMMLDSQAEIYTQAITNMHAHMRKQWLKKVITAIIVSLLCGVSGTFACLYWYVMP